VILVGTPEIDFWLQPPGSREAKVEKLKLLDLPERPDKATRLRITAKTGFGYKGLDPDPGSWIRGVI